MKADKGKRVGQKKAFKLEDIWRIRIRLELENNIEQLVMFNLAIDSILGGYRTESQLRTCSITRWINGGANAPLTPFKAQTNK